MGAWDAGLTRFRLDGNVKHENGQQFLAGQGFAGERMPRVHRVEPHGFTSHPVADGLAVLVQSRGNRDSAYALGGANPALIPVLPQGGTAIYDHQGNIVSLVMTELRVVHAQKITLKAPEIVLDGAVKLGSADAARPISAQGSLDSAGHVQVGNLASNVYI